MTVTADRHRATTGPWRLFRGVVVGTFAAALATWAHLLAGGALPRLVPLLGMCGVALGGCVLASRWSWRLPGLVALLLLAQAAFHVGFSAYDAVGSAHGDIHPGMGHRTGWAGSLNESVPDAGMLVLHVLAAFLLAGVLRHGERILGAFLDVVGLRLASLLRGGLAAIPHIGAALGLPATLAQPGDAPVRLCWARGPPA